MKPTIESPPRRLVASLSCAVALLLAFAFASALASTASAASLVYLDATYNVGITSPDGLHKRQVTTDGTPDKRYTAPSADDQGVILSYGHPDRYVGRLMDQTGADVRGPWLLPAPTCSLGPLSSDIAADGKLIAATWIDAGTGPTSCIYPGQLTTSVLFGDGPTINAHNGSAVLPSFDDMTDPRWIYRPTQRLGAITQDTINVQDFETPPGNGQMASWIGVPTATADLDSFDVSRVADRLLVETSAEGYPDAGEQRDLELLTFTGAPPAATVTHVCFVDALVAKSTKIAAPRWSPDGSMIAWTGADGVYVSPAPVPGTGDQCAIQPKLIVPGGFYAAWTRADVAVPPAATTPGPPPTPATPPAPTTTTQQSISEPKVMGATAAGGIRLSVRLALAARISVTIDRLPKAGRKGKAKRLGTTTFTGKAGSNTLTIRRIARRKLGKGRYRITISVNGAARRVVVVTVRR